MYVFSGSKDSRYFLCKGTREIVFSREEKVLWKKPFQEKSLEVLGVGNNGVTAVLVNEGIRIINPSEKEPEEFVDKFSKNVLSSRASYIGKAVLKDSGTQICIDIISGKSKGAEKLFPAFGKEKAPKMVEYHEIIFYSVAGKNHETFYRYEQPKDHEGRFLWTISSDFNYIAIAEPQKKSGGKKTRFSVVKTTTYEAYQEFTLKDAQINQILVNDNGFAFMDLVTDGTHDLFVINQEGKRFNITPPSDYEVLHLGNSFVAILEKNAPSLLIKSFDDVVMTHSDLKTLNELNIPFSLLFNAKDNIDLVYLLEDEIKVLRSDIDRIHIDTKRWDIIGKRATYSPSSEPVDMTPVEERQATAEESKKEQRAPVEENEALLSVPSASREEIIRSLESIRVEYIMGQINEEQYKKTKEKLEKDLLTVEYTQVSERQGKEIPAPDVAQPLPASEAPMEKKMPAPEKIVPVEKGRPDQAKESPVEKGEPVAAPAKEAPVKKAEPIPSKEALPVEEPVFGMELPVLELDMALVKEDAPVAAAASTPVKEAPAAKTTPAPVKEATPVKAEPVPAKEPSVAKTEPVPPVQKKQKQPPAEKAEPVAAVPAEKAQTDEKPEVPKAPSEDRVKLEKLLEVLEERLMVGLVSEATYNNLKEKYSRALALLDQ